MIDSIEQKEQQVFTGSYQKYVISKQSAYLHNTKKKQVRHAEMCCQDTTNLALRSTTCPVW